MEVTVLGQVSLVDQQPLWSITMGKTVGVSFAFHCFSNPSLTQVMGAFEWKIIDDPIIGISCVIRLLNSNHSNSILCICNETQKIILSIENSKFDLH